jgi:DNA-binding NarL/FixJ family response regulator
MIGVKLEDSARLATALATAISGVETSVALLDIVVLNSLAPEFLLIDIDSLLADPLEALRQLRFVLPNCVIIVYTGSVRASVVRDCHNAGANCLLSKLSTERQLVAGLRHAMWSGCFTDPRFVASA